MCDGRDSVVGEGVLGGFLPLTRKPQVEWGISFPRAGKRTLGRAVVAQQPAYDSAVQAHAWLRWHRQEGGRPRKVKGKWENIIHRVAVTGL